MHLDDGKVDLIPGDTSDLRNRAILVGHRTHGTEPQSVDRILMKGSLRVDRRILGDELVVPCDLRRLHDQRLRPRELEVGATDLDATRRGVRSLGAGHAYGRRAVVPPSIGITAPEM